MALEHRLRLPQIPCSNEITVSWSFYRNRTKKAKTETLVDAQGVGVGRGVGGDDSKMVGLCQIILSFLGGKLGFY